MRSSTRWWSILRSDSFVSHIGWRSWKCRCDGTSMQKLLVTTMKFIQIRFLAIRIRSRISGLWGPIHADTIQKRMLSCMNNLSWSLWCWRCIHSIFDGSFVGRGRGRKESKRHRGRLLFLLYSRFWLRGRQCGRRGLLVGWWWQFGVWNLRGQCRRWGRKSLPWLCFIIFISTKATSTNTTRTITSEGRHTSKGFSTVVSSCFCLHWKRWRWWRGNTPHAVHSLVRSICCCLRRWPWRILAHICTWSS